MTPPLLEQLTTICEQLRLPVRVGVFTETPLPDYFVTLTPLTDSLSLYADNSPGVELEEARMNVFAKGNYLGLRDALTYTLLTAGITITSRSYIGFEEETGYHHYALDTLTHHPM